VENLWTNDRVPLDRYAFGRRNLRVWPWVRFKFASMDKAQDFAPPHRMPSALAEGRARIERQRAIIARLEQLGIDSAKQETMPSRQAPVFLPTASDNRHNADIQAAAIGGAYGADHCHDDVPGPRRRGSLVVAMTALALAALGTAGTFAYCAMFGVYVFPALPPIVNAGTGPDNNVWNNSDTRRSNSSQTSLTNAGSSEKLVLREQQPIDSREAPKTIPRVISAIPIASNPSAPPLNAAGSAAVAPPVPAATAPALDPPVPSALAPHVAPSVPPASGSVPASSEPKETAVAAPLATAPALAPPVLTEASVPPPASAPVPVPASSEPKNILTVIDTAGWGETDTSSPPALAPDSATSTAARPSVAAARTVGNPDAQRDAAPPPPSHSPLQAGRGTAGGGYTVQVASERSAAQTHASFRALRAKFPNQLGGREPIVRRIYVGAKGIYYRAMIGPFASMERAAGMCSTLKAAGGSCLVQRN
jgi:SPOR domain